MLQLDAIFVEESMEEVRCRDHEPVLLEVDERHRLARLQEWEDISNGRPPPSNLLQSKEALLHKPLQPRLCHLRRYPLTHFTAQEKSRAATTKLSGAATTPNGGRRRRAT